MHSRVGTVLVCISVVVMGGCSAAPSPSATLSAASAEPSIETATPSPRLRPTVTPSGVPRPSVTPRPSQTALEPLELGPIGGTGWIVLDLGPLPTFFSAEWSPDGAHLLLDRGRLEGTGFDLYTAGGTHIRRHERGDRALWLDAQRYLLIDGIEHSAPHEGHVVDVETGQASEVALPTDFIVASGHGPIAFVVRYRNGGRCEPWGCPDPKFVLWTPEDGFGVWRTGLPMGWSLSGDRLFVLNVDSPPSKPVGAPAAPRIEGWLEVLGMPDLESVRRYRDVRMSDDLFALDPNGPHVAFIPTGSDRQNEIRLLDLASGDVTEVLTQGWSAVWNDSSLLVVGPTANGSWAPSGDAVVVDASGDLVTTWPGVGEYVMATPDGSVIAFAQDTADGRVPSVTVFLDGQRLDVETPSANGYAFRCSPTLAPDGSALALGCHYYDSRGNVDNSVALLLQLQ